EPICRHFRQCPDYFFSQFDTSDGTLRLPPAVTKVASLDIAYTPITMWEDHDAAGLRAFYLGFRDTSSTPDIVIKKYDVRDDSLIDTELSTDAGFGGGAATETAPRMGRVVSFEGKTFFAPGEESGSNHIQKITVGDIATPTADTYTEGDHFSSSHAVIEEDGVAKFISCDGHEFRTAATTPETDANFSGLFEVGDSGSPIFWSVESGGFVYACKSDNLYELDPTSARPLLDMRAERKNKVFQTYDDFDGHMAATVGAAVLYPHRSGFWRYRSGRSLNLSIDNIPGYRAAAGVDDVLIGLRHYATDAVGQWVYAIYKPPGFANTTNCNIMSAFYDPGSARELTWRTLISRTEDLLGLKIDSDKRLWFVQNPNDPAVSGAGTVTFVSASSGSSSGTTTSISWSHTVASGTDRVLRVAVSSLSHTPASVRFGGRFLSLVKTVGAGGARASLWVLTAPAVRTTNITVVWDAAQSAAVGGADNWTGVDQSQPLRNATSATGTSASPSVIVTSAVGDEVLDVVSAVGNVSATDDSGDSTERWNATDSTSGVRGAGSSETGASSVTASWTLGSSVAWAIVAASLQPTVVGAATADLNYIQLNNNGSPRTILGRDRG
ncbi:hypothetical protein LCGC14_2232950, partial [marine sediment metagenome]